MARVEETWIRQLELRFGVAPDFARRLVPMLRLIAARTSCEREWIEVLSVVADAYHSTRERERERESRAGPSIDETLRLLSLFNGELRKIDEALKVLAACLTRVRTQVRRSTPGDPLH